MSRQRSELPAVPPGLGLPGRRLWRAVHRALEDLRADELIALGAACRSADELTRLEVELARAPVMLAGSKGQDVVHPLFAEVRAHRLALTRLLARVGIEMVEAAAPETRSSSGRRLALVRWQGTIGTGA
jgi:hypothetical protein